MKALSILGLFLMVSICATQYAPPCQLIVLRAMVDHEAILPCGQAKVFLDGPEAHVSWFKDEETFITRKPGNDMVNVAWQYAPFGSLTAANMIPPNCENVNFRESIKSLCKEDTCPDNTSLRIGKVTNDQAGIYRCRISYDTSPALDMFIDLKTVPAPSEPIIRDEAGKALTNPVFYLVPGRDLILSCAIDVQPSTWVWWERNGVALRRDVLVKKGELRTALRIINASRDEADVNYRCLVQNSDVSAPLTKTITIIMILPPVSVEIRSDNNTFEAGEPRVVDCVVVGCLPPPKITWQLGNQVLRTSHHQELHDGNYTISSLTLTPSIRDDYHDLICRVHNSKLPNEVFEDKIELRVLTMPVCVNNPTKASDVEIRTSSATCTVESYPRPENFSWTFSGKLTRYTKVEKVPGYENRYESTLIWDPREMREGMLNCRASHVKGYQKFPCVFNIFETKPPLTPKCKLGQISNEYIKIICNKGWALSQIINADLENDKGKIVKTYRDTNGEITIPRSEAKDAIAVLYTRNNHGTSDRKPISLTPPPVKTKQNVNIELGSPGSIFHALIPILSVLVFLVIVTLLISYAYQRTRRAAAIIMNREGQHNVTSIRTEVAGSSLGQPDYRPLREESARFSLHPPRVTLSIPAHSLPSYLAQEDVESGPNENFGELLFPHQAARILGIVPATTTVHNENEMLTYYV